ncbi:MAG: restriction endonuclease [Actinomycetota bacterium]
MSDPKPPDGQASGNGDRASGEEAAPASGRRRLTYTGDFSLKQMESLTKVLEAVAPAAGDRDKLKQAIAAAYPKIAAGAKREGNVLLSLLAHGLIDPDTFQLSPLANELRALPDEDARLARFAKHMIEERMGIDVLQVVHDLALRHEKANKAAIDAELRRRGFDLPGDTTYHTFMLGWMAASGACSYDTKRGTWQVHNDKLHELIGISFQEVDEFSSLSQAQRLFLRTLQKIGQIEGTSPVQATRVRKETVARYGIEFKGAMRDRVINPLEKDGWLTSSDVQSKGKSGKVAATDKLLKLDIDVAQTLSTGLIPPDLRKRLNTPVMEIYRALSSGTKNEQGVALELLALRLAYDVGLAPMGFRVRSVDTGYAEVDLVAEGANLLFSRWLFQCKATKGTVPVHDLAKEIGMATLLHAHVVVMVTRGAFSRDLVEHALRAAQNTHLQVVLIDAGTLERYRMRGAAAILDFLLDTAADTLRAKRPQVVGIA